MRVFGLNPGKGAEMAERSVTAGRPLSGFLEPAVAEEEAACGAAHRAEPQRGKGDASGKEGEGPKEGGVSTGLRSGRGEPLSVCEAACSAKKCSPVSPRNPKPKAVRSHSSQTHVISDLPTKREPPGPAHMGTHTCRATRTQGPAQAHTASQEQADCSPAPL